MVLGGTKSAAGCAAKVDFLREALEFVRGDKVSLPDALARVVADCSRGKYDSAELEVLEDTSVFTGLAETAPECREAKALLLEELEAKARFVEAERDSLLAACGMSLADARGEVLMHNKALLVAEEEKLRGMEGGADSTGGLSELVEKELAIIETELAALLVSSPVEGGGPRRAPMGVELWYMENIMREAKSLGAKPKALRHTLQQWVRLGVVSARGLDLVLDDEVWVVAAEGDALTEAAETMVAELEGKLADLREACATARLDGGQQADGQGQDSGAWGAAMAEQRARALRSLSERCCGAGPFDAEDRAFLERELRSAEVSLRLKKRNDLPFSFFIL